MLYINICYIYSLIVLIFETVSLCSLVLRQSYCIALAKPRIQFADQAGLEFRFLPLLLLGLKVCYIDL